jgi:hypothetical protein
VIWLDRMKLAAAIPAKEVRFLGPACL